MGIQVFLFLIQNIDCGLERKPTIYVLSKNKKNKKTTKTSTENFHFYNQNIFSILRGHVFLTSVEFSSIR